MVLQLVKDKITGIYKYQEIGKPTTPAIDTSAYDAYTGNQKTTLATGTGATTDIGQQTESILRETPGQVSFNPRTGTIEQKDSEGKKIGVDTITDISTTGEQTEMMETPIEKAARIAAMTGGTGQTGQVGFDDSLIRRSLDLQERAQKINTITKTADLGLQAYRAYKGIGKVGSIMQGTTGPITPLSGGTFGSNTFMGGAGTAGMAGYQISSMLGGDKKENTAAGVGSAIGFYAGGPVGAVVGGAIGRVIGCFLPDTEITMSDGSKKKIIDIELKDNIKVGGNVFATAKFLINNLYDYKGVKVSGSHMVNENNKWIRVEDSNIAKSLGNDEHVVYTLGTQNRRIVINDILFTDYFEIDEKEELVKQGDSYFDTWKLHSDYLSQQNVYKINEKQTLELR